jgi:tRNA(Ile)-lysidine synthase TilS/MesJ
MSLKKCTRCGLPENWGITNFDKQGVCNYCRYYDTVKDKLRDFERWEKLFADHLDQHKGKYKYDVVVGFSGGKDSSYIVHKLKTHYQCSVLALTVNFGFMPSEFALDNSKRVAKSLNVDHIIYDATYDEIQEGFIQPFQQNISEKRHT